MPQENDPPADSVPTPSKSESRKPPTWKMAWMRNDTGQLVRTIRPTSLESGSITISSEPGFETLCSYNWQIDGKAILVSGGPPKWSPPPLPFALTQDASRSTAQDPLQVPDYPSEPVFQAMATMKSYVQLQEVDLILNRNSLRKLLDYATGKRQESFCMGLDMVKDTLFISRKEKHAHMISLFTVLPILVMAIALKKLLLDERTD